MNEKGPKGPPDKKGKGDKGDKGPKDEQAKAAAPTSAIQWYATWDSANREAQVTGRPILLVSAAPHCAGVSGTW